MFVNHCSTVIITITHLPNILDPAPTELQLLVNSDDVIEEDEELPPSLPPTLTTSHQHYQASKPKDVVFVERRGD